MTTRPAAAFAWLPSLGVLDTAALRAGNARIDTLVFWPIDPTARQVEPFAGEVVPLLAA
jgi:hypothetical protein